MAREEFELIDWIRRNVRDRPPVTLGIGDDAAWLSLRQNSELLVAVDMLMEGVHFTFPEATPRLAGRKALAVNLSDIAAMAGKPSTAFVAVSLPRNRGKQFAEEVHAGVIELADEFDVILAGGDTNSWDGPLVICVTVLGTPLKARPACRSGAQIGDWLFVTGALGGSLPSQRHLTFMPRVNEARMLSERVEVHSMIDISDGLAADLHHVLDASNVGCELIADEIPLTAAALHSTDGRSPLLHGLSDGEDFELLFSVSPSDGQLLQSAWRESTSLTRIGQITQTLGCRLHYADGRIEPLPPLGWTHALTAGD